MELYKGCINNDPGMTLTYFMARSAKVAYPKPQVLWIDLGFRHTKGVLGTECTGAIKGLINKGAVFYFLKKKERICEA